MAAESQADSTRNLTDKQAEQTPLELRAQALALRLRQATEEHSHPPLLPEDQPSTSIDWKTLSEAVARRRKSASSPPKPSASQSSRPTAPSKTLLASEPKPDLPKPPPLKTPAPLKEPVQDVKNDHPACVQISEDPARPPSRQRSVWILSMAAHAGIVVLLSLCTLSISNSRDQIAFTASFTTTDEPLQTANFEAPPETIETSEPTPQEVPIETTALEPDPAMVTSEIAFPQTDDSMDPFDSIDPYWKAGLVVNEGIESKPYSEAQSKMTTEFCGIQGGGNHFCFIVDSSKSMKNGRFDAARQELLKAIDHLHSGQYFYVIFYDSHIDPMRVVDPTVPDPFSVPATDENKRSLRRWAMSVSLERGAPPDKALKRAFKLNPDVIFLLSDGEFPERTEKLVAKLNQSDSLLYNGPQTILHTIGYHNRAGEARMRRLAKENGGQYRYIKKP